MRIVRVAISDVFVPEHRGREAPVYSSEAECTLQVFLLHISIVSILRHAFIPVREEIHEEVDASYYISANFYDRKPSF